MHSMPLHRGRSGGCASPWLQNTEPSQARPIWFNLEQNPNPIHLSVGDLRKTDGWPFSALDSIHRFVSVLSGNHALCPRQKGGPRDRQPTLLGRRHRRRPTKHGFGTKLCKCDRLSRGTSEELICWYILYGHYQRISAPDHQMADELVLCRLPLGIPIRQIR